MSKFKQRRGLKKNKESQQQKQKYQSSNPLLFSPPHSDSHDYHHQKIQQNQLKKMNNTIKPQNVFDDNNLKTQQDSIQLTNNQIQNQSLIGQKLLWLMKFLILILFIFAFIALQIQISKIENNNVNDEFKNVSEQKQDIQDLNDQQKSLPPNIISIIQNTIFYGPFNKQGWKSATASIGGGMIAYFNDNKLPEKWDDFQWEYETEIRRLKNILDEDCNSDQLEVEQYINNEQYYHQPEVVEIKLIDQGEIN